MVVLGFFQQPFDIASFEGEYAVRNTYVIWYCGNGHLGIVFLEVQEEVFVVDVGEEITVHQQNSVIEEFCYKLNATNCTKKMWLTNGLNLYTIARFLIMFLYLLFQIINSYINMLYSVRNQPVNIVVDDGFVAYRE